MGYLHPPVDGRARRRQRRRCFGDWGTAASGARPKDSLQMRSNPRQARCGRAEHDPTCSFPSPLMGDACSCARYRCGPPFIAALDPDRQSPSGAQSGERAVPSLCADSLPWLYVTLLPNGYETPRSGGRRYHRRYRWTPPDLMLFACRADRRMPRCGRGRKGGDPAPPAALGETPVVSSSHRL